MLWLNRLETEHDNLREALSFMLTSAETKNASRLAAALGRFWYVRGHLSEGRSWLERVLAALGDACIVERTGVLRALGTLVGTQGDAPRYEARLAEEAMELSRTLGDEPGIAWSLHGRGNVAQRRGDLAEATHLYEEALSLFRRVHDRPGIAAALNNLGLIAAEQCDTARARELLEEALGVYRSLGNQRGMAIALCNVGQRVGSADGNQAAISYYQEALPLFQSVGDKAGIAWGLHALADVAAAEGAPSTATRLHGAAAAIRERIGWSFSPRERIEYDRGLAAVRELMGDVAFGDEWSAGHRMMPDQAMMEASKIVASIEREVSRRPALPAGLSEREAEVLRLLASGLTNGEIANRLNLSPHTIDAHLRRVYRKAGVRSRSAATRFALDHDLA